MIFGPKIEKCKKKYAEYEQQKQNLYILIDGAKNAKDEAKQQQKLRYLLQEFDEFVCDVYARYIFEECAPNSPELIVVSTNEIVSWNDVFGTSFEKNSKLRKFSLVYLIEGNGKYKFK